MEIKFKPGTPQFRTALIRRMRKLEPDYEIEVLDTDNGTMFRLIDSWVVPGQKKLQSPRAIRTASKRSS
ncbi:MAG: hypothetical protein AAFV69_15430 [Pseudomonadota bacterium]